VHARSDEHHSPERHATEAFVLCDAMRVRAASECARVVVSDDGVVGGGCESLTT